MEATELSSSEMTWRGGEMPHCSQLITVSDILLRSSEVCDSGADGGGGEDCLLATSGSDAAFDICGVCDGRADFSETIDFAVLFFSIFSRRDLGAFAASVIVLREVVEVLVDITIFLD